jgi:hypothetical protein
VKRFLVLGDLHIPRRASRIPPELAAAARGREIDAVLCTGDLVGEEIPGLLAGFAPEVHAVSGNMDTLDLPRMVCLEAEGWRIGIAHGNGIHPRGDPEGLARLAAEMDVDLLANGHTHVGAAYRHDTGKRSIVLLNPGSATGVEGGSGGPGIPSLAVLELSPGKAAVDLWSLAPSGPERTPFTFTCGR